ncbi:MAG: hypothetical protein ACLPSW_13405 [Roseiarcus sp.]
MKRMNGRCIYIVDLAATIDGRSPADFANCCSDARLSAIWIRVGRGATPDKNLKMAALPTLLTALKNQGIEIWGWHVPFCAEITAARREATLAINWIRDNSLDGLIVDAERTPESPRFRGNAAEAEAYCGPLQTAMASLNKGLALSSHDQPAVHADLPFETFLRHILDICPQVYYRTPAVSARLTKSFNQYKALDQSGGFEQRYKPTGNVTVSGDMRFPSVSQCLKATEAFIQQIRARRLMSYSFWCWDEAPTELFTLLSQLPT